MWWLLVATALAAPPEDPPAGASELPALSQASSAVRLREMVGEHHPGPPLTRGEVLAAIDERHPKLRAAEAAFRGAEAERRGALSFRDPRFESKNTAEVIGYYRYLISDSRLAWDSGPASVEVGYRVGRGLEGGDAGLPAYYGEYETLDGGELRVGLSVNLLEGLWTDPDRTGLRTAQLQLEEAEALVRLARLDLSRKGVATWAKWVASGRILTLDEVLLQVARERQRAVDARIELGDLASIERVRNRQILAARRADLADARGDFAASTQALSLYLRGQDGALVEAVRDRLPDRRDAPEVAQGYGEDPVSLALSSHPLLIVARARLGIAEAEARLARQGRMPEVGLQAGIAQDLQASGPDDSTLSPMSGTVGATLKVPLGNLKDRANVQSTRNKRDKAFADLRWLEDQVAVEVRAADARERAALASWQAATEQVELGLVLQEAEQRRFDVGDIDLLRLWQVEQETAKAIRTEVKAWKAYQVALAELEYAVGRPTRSALRPPEGP